jgi:hypothetical protein
MIYMVCVAKNEIAMNEKEPVFNSDNWEFVESFKCRSNASPKTFDSAYQPVFKRIKEKHENEDFRLWYFKQYEVV